MGSWNSGGELGVAVTMILPMFAVFVLLDLIKSIMQELREDLHRFGNAHMITVQLGTVDP